MDTKELIESNKEGFFVKIKNWFKNLFGMKSLNKEIDDEFNCDISNLPSELDEEINSEQKLKYEFSNDSVSKQKIEKIKKDLDIGYIGFEELYQLNDKELNELSKLYEEQINNTVTELNEIQNSLDGYIRKLEKISLQNQ